jgi:hypothetical protein
MIDPSTFIVTCDCPEQILHVTNEIMPQLAPDVRKRFLKVRMMLLIQFKEHGVHARMNNKTICQILAENTDFSGIEKLASGREKRRPEEGRSIQ